MPPPAPAPIGPQTRVGHRLAELDALRGVAALAVALYHFTYFIPFVLPGTPLPSVTLWWGCYGVQLFFAISGFVILGSLERGAGIARFARARARRLLPEYWLAMAISAGLAALLGPARLRIDLATWIFNLPLMQLVTGTRMVDGVYWSLNVEIVFYTGMAIAWRLGWTRRIETLVLGWLALKWLARGALGDGIAAMLCFDQAAYFAVGLVAYRVWTGERPWRAQLPVLAAAFATVLLLDPVHAHWVFAALAPGFLLLATGRATWLAQPALVWMGWLSYPFYLLHATIGYAMIVWLEARGIAPDAATLATLALTGLLAWAMAAAFERGRRRRPATPWPPRTAPVPA